MIEFLLTVSTSYELWTFYIIGDNGVGFKIDNEDYIKENVCQGDVELTISRRLYKGTHFIRLHHYRYDYTGTNKFSLYYSNEKQEKTLLQGDFIYQYFIPKGLKYSITPSYYIDTEMTISNTNYFLNPEYSIYPPLPNGLIMDSTSGKISGITSVVTPLTEYVISVKSAFVIIQYTEKIEIYGIYYYI